LLDSIQKYVCNSILDGLPIPIDGVPPLTAWLTPPAVESVDGPRAHVWGGNLPVNRQTAPRGPGFKKFQWTISNWLVYLTDPDDGLNCEPMPKIIDAVMWAFMTTTMPLFIDVNGVPMGPNAVNKTDTQIQSIGESMHLQYPPERMVGPMQMLWYTSLLDVTVTEVVQA